MTQTKERKPTAREIESYRTVDIKAEVRTEESGKKMILRGYPILFNTPTIISSWWRGEYEETIAPAALDKTDLRNVYLMVGHNPDNVLGREGINMRLERDETGLFFECELPNTQYARDWYNLVEIGIVDGMSFGFNCEGDTWTEETETEKAKRQINNITKLWEITITPFPAYGEASVITKTENNRSTAEGEKTEAAENNEGEAAEKARSELENKLKKLEEM